MPCHKKELDYFEIACRRLGGRGYSGKEGFGEYGYNEFDPDSDPDSDSDFYLTRINAVRYSYVNLIPKNRNETGRIE